MKPLFTALVLFCGALPLYAQQVILDLDKGYPEDQFYTIPYSPLSALTLTSARDGHNGRSATADWRIEVGAGNLGYAGFGYLHPVSTTAEPFPDLTSFTHLSIWFNNVEAASSADKVAFRFELHEANEETGPDGDSRSQVWIYEAYDVLTTPKGWTQRLIPLVQTDALGPDGFAIAPGDFQGNGRLDLDQIKHWTIILLVEGEPVGTVFEGKTRFDYLTAEQLPVATTPTPEAPLADALHANFPNPFAASTTLSYTLRQPADVSLKIYDLLGREVAVPIQRQRQTSGQHEVPFDGSLLARGTYVYVLEVDGARFTRKMIRAY